jgi:hypothetical protein
LGLCIIALNGMKNSGNESGKGLAIAGIVCSSIYILIDFGLLVAHFSARL